jgi:hypothetical protein
MSHRDRVAAALAAFMARRPHGRGPDRSRQRGRTPEGRLTGHQARFLERVRQHDGIAAVLRSVDDARATIVGARKEAPNG